MKLVPFFCPAFLLLPLFLQLEVFISHGVRHEVAFSFLSSNIGAGGIKNDNVNVFVDVALGRLPIRVFYDFVDFIDVNVLLTFRCRLQN